MSSVETWQLRAQFANLDGEAVVGSGDAADYSHEWMAGQIGHHIHNPYDLYEKVASS
ncbi:hypothetical protein KXD97_14830 [Mycobacterium sp. SMC-8]|uniref:hypothetical protein n=1 Tax=Mycobacterium sp. SMC-8 TaxID=2857060 RepID=UPI0021B40716|nr:hypothetical protein [Mycobacterium sp. SMC-8]UXA15654.1 hypothetical protein KXD97_14830 [Mycobacterium sp. SMC-8]